MTSSRATKATTGPSAGSGDIELLALGQPDFTERVGDLAQRHLIDDADRTAAAIIRSSVQGVQAVAVKQLELLSRAFTQRLRTR